MKAKETLKRIWHFIWVEDSLASWIANVVIAFVLVKFIIYPLMGLLLGTSYPVVAVVSGSMEHNGESFDAWWSEHGAWYEQQGFTKEQLEDAKFRNGFNKGDIIFLLGTEPENIKTGSVIVYSTDKYKYPIIHRVVNTEEKGSDYYFETKGDNNAMVDPASVSGDKIIGRAVLKVPKLGWIKILFTKIIGG